MRLMVSRALRPQSTNTRASPATIRVALPELPLASMQTRIGNYARYDDDQYRHASKHTGLHKSERGNKIHRRIKESQITRQYSSSAATFKEPIHSRSLTVVAPKKLEKDRICPKGFSRSPLCSLARSSRGPWSSHNPSHPRLRIDRKSVV